MRWSERQITRIYKCNERDLSFGKCANDYVQKSNKYVQGELNVQLLFSDKFILDECSNFKGLHADKLHNCHFECNIAQRDDDMEDEEDDESEEGEIHEQTKNVVPESGSLNKLQF